MFVGFIMLFGCGCMEDDWDFMVDSWDPEVDQYLPDLDECIPDNILVELVEGPTVGYADLESYLDSYLEDIDLGDCVEPEK